MSLFISITFCATANDNQFATDLSLTGQHNGMSIDTFYAFKWVHIVEIYTQCCCVRPPPPNLPTRITRQICKNTLLISCQKWQPPSYDKCSLPPPHFHFHFSFPAVHLRPNTLSTTISPAARDRPNTTYSTLYMSSRIHTWDNPIPCPLCSE